jgi:hypothetical protein
MKWVYLHCGDIAVFWKCAAVMARQNSVFDGDCFAVAGGLGTGWVVKCNLFTIYMYLLRNKFGGEAGGKAVLRGGWVVDSFIHSLRPAVKAKSLCDALCCHAIVNVLIYMDILELCGRRAHDWRKVVHRYGRPVRRVCERGRLGRSQGAVSLAGSWKGFVQR